MDRGNTNRSKRNTTHLTWIEVIQINLKKYSSSNDLTKDKSKWRNNSGTDLNIIETMLLTMMMVMHTNQIHSIFDQSIWNEIFQEGTRAENAGV